MTTWHTSLHIATVTILTAVEAGTAMSFIKGTSRV
jgi:hypothetical protein